MNRLLTIRYKSVYFVEVHGHMIKFIKDMVILGITIDYVGTLL